MSQAEDIEAINRYIMEAPIVNSDAVKVRDEWVKWHDALGWYDKNVAGGTYDAARNFRNRFNVSNTKSAAEKKDIQESLKRGLTSEQAQGGVDRRISTGSYIEEAKPLIPAEYKVVAVVGGVLLGGLFIYGLSTAIPAAFAGYMATRRLRAPQS